MKKFNKVLLLFFVLGLIVYPASAKTIDFKNTYQDSNGNWLKEDALNLSLFPLYTVDEDANNYIISRMGHTVTLPKRSWITYNFYSDRIVPVITIQSYAQIDSLVTKVNSTSWYLTVPFLATHIVSTTDELIDMMAFKRTISISVVDSNTTPNYYYILPKVIGGNIRLYLNPQTYSGVVYPLILTENTITVTNVSTSGFTSANVSLNGSRWTDSGQLAINLNASYLNGLVGYWSMDETTGTTIHNINTESGLINTTNQGTWNGNTTLNYTIGHIGNAGYFDGVDDYINMGTNKSLNITNEITIGAYIRPNNTTTLQGIVSKKQVYGDFSGYLMSLESGNIRFSYGNGSASFTRTSDPAGLSLVSYNYVAVVYNGSNVLFYVNGIGKGSTVSTGTIANSAFNLVFGARSSPSSYFNGSIDEVKIWNRALSASEIAEEYNRSMRTQAMPVILNQSASIGNVINRTRITYSGQDAVNNISIYARQNTTTSWNLIQANATSNTWYSITNQYQVMDFGLMMSGNGSNTTFFESLEWDETTAPGTPTTLLRSYQWIIG